MNFGLSDEQEMIVSTVRSFVENEIYPYEDAVERTGEVDPDLAAAIKAKTIVIVCAEDLYFRPEDNQLEIEHIENGELRIYDSPWGHCVASPGNSPEFEQFLDQAISELLQ